MSNMSYCRFRNTLDDLRDCQANLDDALDNHYEAEARLKLVSVCQKIVDSADLEYIEDEAKRLEKEFWAALKAEVADA